MADDSPSGTKEADSSGGAANEGGKIWRGIKSLLFGNDGDQTLRRELEEAIDGYDEEGGEEAGQRVKGELSPLERQMRRHLLHFSEHTGDDMAVRRADIVAIEEGATVATHLSLFRAAGDIRNPVHRNTTAKIIARIHHGFT